MTVAIFGLIGVVVGGLLNGGVTWFFERRYGKTAVRVQARALLTLLMDGELALRQTAKARKLLVPSDLGWQIRALDLRALWAEADDDTWIEIATAGYLVEQASGWPDEEIPPADAAQLRTMADRVHDGVNALQPFALPSKQALPPAELPESPEDEPQNK
jgi:hypothetical protein